MAVPGGDCRLSRLARNRFGDRVGRVGDAIDVAGSNAGRRANSVGRNRSTGDDRSDPDDVGKTQCMTRHHSGTWRGEQDAGIRRKLRNRDCTILLLMVGRWR